MNWEKQYTKKLCSAEDAVKHIKSSSTVVLAHGVGEPVALINAMVENGKNYKNVEIKHMVSFNEGRYAQEEFKENFRVNPMFASGNVRKALAEGRGDFTPVFFHEVPKYFREGLLNVDVLMCQVTPPDKHGFVSLGTSVDYTLQALRSANLVLAQVNSFFPKTYGESMIHISELDSIIEKNEKIPELAPPKIGDVERSIGEYCASLIDDDCTLQLGIGAIPDAVMLFLDGKKNLGIHSEMISDGTLALYEKGVITNSKKTTNRGKMVVTFLMGTQKLYDFVDDNPIVEVRPVDYVNHPVTIMKQHKMTSVNSAIQVDLQGQVAAESIGLKQFSGVGGQVDFIRGASMADCGKSIIAMPSITVKKDGSKINKIVPFLDKGAAVTTSRNDVDYVVTEFGIAPLKGKSLRERARNLIAIGHPDFQDELMEEFGRRF